MTGLKPDSLTILGIETSCDETAAAVVRRTAAARGEILSNIVRSQMDIHAPYGGVVPEIAARAHVSHLDRLVEKALESADARFADLDGVAATAGPGLIGGVLVGLVTAKALASVHGIPLMAVNHLEGHALTARLTHGLDFPYLLLLVSGGHSQLLIVGGIGRYRRLGTTIDDALGEAFDKTAKLLGLCNALRADLVRNIHANQERDMRGGRVRDRESKLPAPCRGNGRRETEKELSMNR